MCSCNHLPSTLKSSNGLFSPAVWFLKVAVPVSLQQMADRERLGCGGWAEVCQREGKKRRWRKEGFVKVTKSRKRRDMNSEEEEERAAVSLYMICNVSHSLMSLIKPSSWSFYPEFFIFNVKDSLLNVSLWRISYYTLISHIDNTVTIPDGYIKLFKIGINLDSLHTYSFY